MKNEGLGWNLMEYPTKYVVILVVTVTRRGPHPKYSDSGTDVVRYEYLNTSIISGCLLFGIIDDVCQTCSYWFIVHVVGDDIFRYNDSMIMQFCIINDHQYLIRRCLEPQMIIKDQLWDGKFGIWGCLTNNTLISWKLHWRIFRFWLLMIYAYKTKWWIV